MSTQKAGSWFFFLCAVEGVLALASLVSIPSEGSAFSPARLVLFVIFLTLILGWLYCGWHSASVLDLFSRPMVLGAASLLCLALGLLLFLLRYLDPGRFLPYYVRLSPLLWYLFLLSLQIAFFLLVRRNGFHPEVLQQNKNTRGAAFLLIFGILLFTLLFVSVTKLGISKDAAYWGEPGVPIPGWLLISALLLGTGFLFYESKFSKTENARLTNLLLPISIWLAAVGLWLSVPISALKNSFYAPITAPYTTPFPYSDAGFYDYLSQSLLIGTDYLGSVPPRPLYVTFLTFLHLLFGQDYAKIIAAQTMVLALFPVALYWLGARIHSRTAGLVIALFAIFRELTSLWISSNTRTSVTKMFLTDFITALFIALACLLAMRWLERRDIKSALVAGGAFGLLLLLRTQSLVILPFLFVQAWFVYRNRSRDWVRGCSIFCAMLVMTLLPWMLRNYVTIGKFALDYASPISVIYDQLSAEALPADFTGQENGGGALLDLLLKKPGPIIGYVVNHFLNTQIGGLLALPLIERFDGLSAPINLYWIDWDGSLAWYNLLLIILYLAVIALGLAAAWGRLHWIGMTPLVFGIGYALSNGITRFSSWRYNLPVDWTVYFYFGIGAIEVLSQAFQLFGANRSTLYFSQLPVWRQQTRRPGQLLLASVFILIGALPWMAEGMASPRYKDQSAVTLEQKVMALPNSPSQAEIEAFISRPESFFEAGRLLYPRFLVRDKGLISSNPWPAYQLRDFPRFGFMLLNDKITSAVFPSKDGSLTFPHAADVIVLGCMYDDYVDVRLVAFPVLKVVHMSAPLTESCSP